MKSEQEIKELASSILSLLDADANPRQWNALVTGLIALYEDGVKDGKVKS